MALTITGGSGTQTNTQSPQTSAGSGISSARSSAVQPGTATSLLTTQNGIALPSTALTTVNLNATSSQPSSSPKTTVRQHHANVMLLGLCGGLLLIALIVFWAIASQAKNTTK